MGDRDEYLETPLPLPPSLYGRPDGRTLVRWRHNQIFSAWRVTNFSYPWCFAGALRGLKLRYYTGALLVGIPLLCEEMFNKESKAIALDSAE